MDEVSGRSSFRFPPHTYIFVSTYCSLYNYPPVAATAAAPAPLIPIVLGRSLCNSGQDFIFVNNPSHSHRTIEPAPTPSTPTRPLAEQQNTRDPDAIQGTLLSDEQSTSHQSAFLQPLSNSWHDYTATTSLSRFILYTNFCVISSQSAAFVCVHE